MFHGYDGRRGTVGVVVTGILSKEGEALPH